MTTPIRIRLAGPTDATTLAAHRVAMFRAMGRTTPETEPALFEHSIGALRTALESGEYVGWVAEDGEAGPIVGGGGVQLRPLLPRPDPEGRRLLLGREGLVLNVFVEPGHRRRGIARRLMEAILAWAPGAGIVRMVLHASDEGRPLYQDLGFTASNEMYFAPGFPPDGGRSR